MKAKNVKIFFLFILISLFANTKAQIIEQYVISSTGLSFNGNGLIADATLGETVINTDINTPSGIAFTQGFHQPTNILSTGQLQLVFGNTIVKKSSCPQAADGAIEIVLTNGVAPFTYQWAPDVGNTPKVSNLTAGEYLVLVTDGIGRTGSTTIKVEPANETCEFDFYTGITPNGDGKNDQWNIGKIQYFPTNKVRIFNRWGSLVFAANGYDNETKVFKGKNFNNQDLPEGTYFYIVEVDNKTFKGWIDLTR
jgi:gliding motility-associated-like protein